MKTPFSSSEVATFGNFYQLRLRSAIILKSARNDLR
uniref:Uncharacterized protein n=1 Tax=viral metagenome TaxID=1070528 RepID=A0A6C0CIU6_9ZZZZ